MENGLAALLIHLNLQQLVGDNNPDKEKVVTEFQTRLRESLNNKNLGLYVKAFMR